MLPSNLVIFNAVVGVCAPFALAGGVEHLLVYEDTIVLDRALNRGPGCERLPVAIVDILIEPKRVRT